jgi:hypothetical protein
MKRENFYRRDPGAALAGMVSMTLEERGVYNTVIDLLYLTWRPLEDERLYIARHCGCAVQKLNPILNRLIDRGKLIRFEVDGVAYISNAKFEDERRSVKGVTTRSGRAEAGEKSGEVGEKSAGVGKNTGLLDHETEEIQGDAALDKSRVDKSSSEAIASSLGGRAGANDVREVVDAIWAVWSREGRNASSKRELARVIRAEISAGGDPVVMIAQARAYSADRSSHGSSGRAKNVAEWFELGRWLDYEPGTAGRSAAQGLGGVVADLSRWDGPDEVRELLLETRDEAFIRSYLSLARYDPGGRRIFPHSGMARRNLADAWGPLKAKGYVLGEVQKGVA